MALRAGIVAGSPPADNTISASMRAREAGSESARGKGKGKPGRAGVRWRRKDCGDMMVKVLLIDADACPRRMARQG